MADIAIQTVPLTDAGLTPAYVAANAGGDNVPNNDGRVMLQFKNTNAAARNVTINSIEACSQGVDHNIVVNVPLATGDKMVGPFPVNRFSSTLALTYDAVPGLTVAAIRLP